MEPQFGGRVYLKGLYIGDSATAKGLKFGYNLAAGQVSRDRKRLTNGGEEASMLAKIWEEAILNVNQEAVTAYTKMLLEDDEKQWADVHMIKSRLTKSTATKIWEHLLSIHLGKNVFYYHQKSASEDQRVVKTSLNKVPMPLPTCIWEPLHKFGIVRTPEEQRHHLLQNAPVSTVKPTLYSAGVERALSAALALDARTRDLNVVFKNNPKANIDLLLVKSDLFISDLWLDFNASHQKLSCFLWELGVDTPDFPCDHIITGLYYQILSEKLRAKRIAHEGASESAGALQLRLDQNLRQMPRTVVISHGEVAYQLRVAWEITESSVALKKHGFDLMYRVVLHRRSTCSDRRKDLLFSSEGSSIDVINFENAGGVAKCGCPLQVVSHQANSATFQQLDCGQEYFPMVSRNCDRAFFGVAPQQMAPNNKNKESASFEKAGIDSKNGLVKNQSDGLNQVADVTKRNAAPKSASTQASFFTSLFPGPSNSGFRGEAPESVPDTKAKGTRQAIAPQSSSNIKVEEEKKATAGLLHRKDEELRSQNQRLRTVSHNLNIKDQALQNTLEQLESLQIELREAKSQAENESERLSSIIEDLRGENHQLQEIQADRNAQVAELSAALGIVQREINEIREANTASNALHIQDTAGMVHLQRTAQTASQQLLDENRNRGAEEAMRVAICALENSNRSLQTEIRQARADRTSMASTLQSLSGLIQSALSLSTRAQMIASLQNVLGMLQGMINLGTRANPVETPPPIVKRERIKEEDELRESSSQASKRSRKNFITID